MITVDQVAQVAHQVNMAYCASQGDTSQKPWKEAPEWQRASAIHGVCFHLDNPDAALSHTHDSWMKEKVESGWVYGPQKDENKKTHPCIVPYEDLPIEQKAKDCLFTAVVSALVKYDDDDVTAQYIAKVAYSVIREYKNFVGEGNWGPWEDLATDEQLSLFNFVAWHYCYSSLHEVDNSWQRWIDSFAEHGWVYGLVEDVDKKVSPSIPSWDQLSTHKKTTFGVYLAIVLTLYPFSRVRTAVMACDSLIELIEGIGH